MVAAAALSLALLSTIAAAQTVHQVRSRFQRRSRRETFKFTHVQVNVGDNGLFFNPQTITAVAGDIVTFNFIGRCDFQPKPLIPKSITHTTPQKPLRHSVNSGRALHASRRRLQQWTSWNRKRYERPAWCMEPHRHGCIPTYVIHRLIRNTR